MKYLAFLYVYIIFYCVGTGSGRGNDGYPTFLTGRSDIRVKQLAGNNHERFPKTYSICLQVGEKLISFELVRDDVITSSLSPALSRLSSYLPDHLITDENTEQFALYHNGKPVDSTERAHFIIYRPDISTPAFFYGQIRTEEHTFNLSPHEGNPEIYKFQKDKDTNDISNTDDFLPTENNIIELFVWFAPDLYEYHSDKLALNGEVWLQSLARSLTREVDLVFKSITSVPIRVYFIGAGYDKGSDSALWYKNNVNGRTMNAASGLADVTSHLQQMLKVGLIPKYDHAVVLTRNMLKENSLHSKSLIQAHGKQYSVCSDEDGSSVSLATVGSQTYLHAIVQSIAIGFGLDKSEDFQQNTPLPHKGISSSKDHIRVQFSSLGEMKLANHIATLSINCLETDTDDIDFFRLLDLTRYADSNDDSIRSKCEHKYGIGAVECSRCKLGKCPYRRASMPRMRSTISSSTMIPSSLAPIIEGRGGYFSSTVMSSTFDPVSSTEATTDPYIEPIIEPRNSPEPIKTSSPDPISSSVFSSTFDPFNPTIEPQSSTVISTTFPLSEEDESA